MPDCSGFARGLSIERLTGQTEGQGTARRLGLARSCLISPEVLGPLAGDPGEVQDRFSAS